MIKIYNNRITYISHRNKKSNVASDELFKFLGEYVELDEKVTFKRIMELLKINEHLVDVVFAHTLGNYPFDLFYEDFLKPLPAEEMKEHNYDHKKQYLEVYYCPDIFKYEKDELFEWNDTLDIHLIEVSKKENISYGIMFSKLGAYQKHKIKIKHEFNLHAHDSTKKITKKSLTTPVLKAKLGGMKLFNFFWAILYEISWMGSPSNRDAEGKKIKETEYRIKNGTEKLIPHDEVMKHLRSKLKKKKK